MKKENNTEMNKKDISMSNASNQSIHAAKNNIAINRTLFIVVTAGLAAAIIILTIGLISFGIQKKDYRTQLENIYQKSFYDAQENINNIDINLSKALLTSSDRQLFEYLNDINMQSRAAMANLSQLPVENEHITKSLKFANQLGDYSDSLINKIKRGGKLSAEDINNLNGLYQTSRNIRVSVGELSKNYRIEFKLADNKKTNNKSFKYINDSFSKLSETGLDYPKLIYDGPFSESIEIKNPKALIGKNIGSAEANRQAVAEKLKDYKISKIKADGETEGELNTHNFILSLKNKNSVYVQVTQQGGYITLMNLYRKTAKKNIEEAQAASQAEEFLKNLGYENMKSVWANYNDGVYYINLASHSGDITLYPDLIKVKVAADNGQIIGLEALAYINNHYERSLPAPKISLEQARGVLRGNLEITKERLAVIPRGQDKEALAYEFFCQTDGENYIIYIDALSGEELDIFRIIGGDAGLLVI